MTPSNMHSLVTFLSLFAALVAVAVGQQCYRIDGSQLDNTFAPCNPSAKRSGCCATNKSTGADLCLDSGLCMSTSGEYTGMIWQNGCTDPTGRGVGCPKICPSTDNDLNSVKVWNVQQCDYGVYCCRAVNDRGSCCNNDFAPTITMSSIGVLQLPTPTTNPTSIQVVATVVSAGTPFNATAAPIVNDCKKEKHQTAVVGGTIGGLFGAVIVGLVGAIWWMYKREKRQRRLKEHYEEQFSQTAAYRRTVASTVSLMGSEMEDMKNRSSEA
ncbi:hypothetical protein BDU57DRAFT_147002 [Ampelomyces quisqualis]|uniref:Mid2 domain-containing protein n=1 Tax=Ampelomyces quisqualis TaxID=50730 RepID=A0A6A5QY73_AMPQU|nr:hypothetical protein BDU57DRAFT_147002 [Ampelomyces quisqualis]